jgi:hypothetical protein
LKEKEKLVKYVKRKKQRCRKNGKEWIWKDTKRYIERDGKSKMQRYIKI